MDPKERFSSLVAIYRLMVFGNSCSGTELDPRILRACVEAYVGDVMIYRAKNPGTQLLDPHKKAAFTIKWIVRYRPIQLIQSDHSAAICKLTINEFYALYSGLSHMNLSISSISEAYVRNFIYNLRRCPVEAETLASEMYLLEQSIRGNPP